MPVGHWPVWLQVVLFCVSLLLLMKGADWLVQGATSLAKKLGISDLVVGLTVVAIGTSSPEFAVSGIAAWNGMGDISLGNVVGSNIFNLGFILAICVIAVPIKIEKMMLYRDLMFLLAGALLLVGLLYSGNSLSRYDGILLLSCLGLYLWFLWKKSSFSGEVPEFEEEIVEVSGGMTAVKLICGLACLLLASRILVDLASDFAARMGVDQWLIGITIVAIGTSLPELVTAIASIMKKNSDLGIGGLIGSDIFNIFGVMGFASILSPVSVSSGAYNQIGFLVGTIFLIGVMMRIGWNLNRWKGILLFVVSLIRYGMEIFKGF